MKNHHSSKELEKHQVNNDSFVSRPIAIVLFTVFVLLAMKVDAQTMRYVDSTGSDTGNCIDPQNACATINYAMSMAGSGDIIDIAAGVYTEQLDITKDLTLQGAGNTQPGGTIIQAHASPNQASGSVISIDGNYSIQILELTIRHGVSYNGGGLNNIHSHLTLTDVTFTENTADYGGGMYNDSGPLTLTNVNFTNNTSVESGGGLNNYTPNGIIVLNDVLFTENTAGNAAGGVALYGGNTIFTNVVFENNIAEDSHGGGLYVSNTNATFTDVSFTNNETQSGGYGGAVYIDDSTVDFVNTSFTGNKVDLNNAGAVYTEESTVNFTNGTFIGNEAAQVGGGLFAFNSELSLFDVLFEDNIAEIGGGVTISSNNTNSAVIQNTHFKDNEATDEFGGGFINEGGVVTLVNTLFTGNRASEYGGAILNAGELHLVNSTITQNETVTGGIGGIVHMMGSLKMSNSIVWGNIAVESPDIGIVTGAVLTANNSLYDDSDVFNEGTFNCDDCLTINPNFTNAAGGDFTLSSNSPAIDVGDPNTDLSGFPTDENNTPIDLNGNMRINNNTIDMGAYEYGVLSNDNFSNTTLKVFMYPNPVNDILHIESDQNIQTISLFTNTGQHLQTLYKQNNIGLTSYTPGTYFVKITTKKSSVVKQVIKK